MKKYYIYNENEELIYVTNNEVTAEKTANYYGGYYISIQKPIPEKLKIALYELETV